MVIVAIAASSTPSAIDMLLSSKTFNHGANQPIKAVGILVSLVTATTPAFSLSSAKCLTINRQ
jgi:hypothetical protein